MFPRVIIPVALLLALSGCAFNNPKNTPLLTALDGVMQPETTQSKVAWGVVFVPVGVAAGAADVLIIHPIQSIELAARDTWVVVWANPPGPPVRQAALFLPKLVLTPMVFGLRWFGNSLFDVQPIDPSKTETKQ